MESRETNNDCSLDLSPNPDSNLFGDREESEEEVQQNQRMVRRKKMAAMRAVEIQWKVSCTKLKKKKATAKIYKYCLLQLIDYIS